MTDLRNSELVIGKGLASLLPVLVMIAVSFPVMTSLTVLGGITLQQVIWVEVVCVVSALAAASWATLVAFWREKTFQTIAITLMGAGLFIGAFQILGVSSGDVNDARFFVRQPESVSSTFENPQSIGDAAGNCSPVGQRMGIDSESGNCHSLPVDLDVP